MGIEIAKHNKSVWFDKVVDHKKHDVKDSVLDKIWY